MCYHLIFTTVRGRHSLVTITPLTEEKTEVMCSPKSRGTGELESLFLALNSKPTLKPAAFLLPWSLLLILAPTMVVSTLSVWCPLNTHRGRFGVVRSCRENATGRTFVAKIVPYAAEGKRRVLQEYEVLRTLHHERLMSLHEAYITPRYLVLIAESCGNRELLCGLSDR